MTHLEQVEKLHNKALALGMPWEAYQAAKDAAYTLYDRVVAECFEEEKAA